MAKKNRITLDYKAISDLASQIDKLGDTKKLQEAAEEALQSSYDLVTKNLEKDIKPHKESGDTEESLRTREKVHWESSYNGYINVGFDIANGGLASIFLMYGTPRHPTNHPGTEADRRIYNDVYGSSIRKKISNIQKEIFQKHLDKMRG